MKKKHPIDKNSTETTMKGRTEKDMDDLVHSADDEMPTEQNEEDPDDKVHQANRRPRQTDQQNSPQDPDDLVHDDLDEEEERNN